jgi:glycosyltransferase involved in cell wall biosynthesis
MGRIILDCDLMRFPNSGLYHYCLNLGREVNNLLDQKGKRRIKFYVPPAEASTFNDPANTIIEKPLHKFFRPFLWDCRVWHAPFQLGRIVPERKKNIKVLFTIHDLNFFHEGVSDEERIKTHAHIQKQIDRSDAIVCISEFTKSDVIKNCEVGNKPLYVIHNGTHSVGKPQLDGNSYKPERKFLFGMGYVNKKKNYHVLVPLLKYNPELELVIAGKLDNEEYVTNMQKLAGEFGVSDRLRILGPVSEDEKAWYFKNCLAFMHPSIAEGFGAPVVESMQFGGFLL